jgi:UDP-GlcNAc:undecaprenyl-phosphate/decaprenyl-phosphate GlcNAc-1-phosphate transferase
MKNLVFYYTAALVTSLALTPICRSLAHRFGFVARPKEDRWHKRPTALLGGVSIALTTLSIGVAMGPDAWVWQLIGCGLVIAAFGLADDLLSLKASTKLIVQISVASALVFFGLRLEWTDSLVGDSMLTLVWIVGITNALNLLDNMDGLCGGITLIAGVFLLASMYTGAGATPAAVYLSILLGATTGFFVYNLHPASIFMGDTGSLFLGLNLAALTLIGRHAGTATSGVLSVMAGPVLLLLVPIFDTTLVTVMRLVSGRRPSQGGRDHSSHRLVALGLPEPTAVGVLWALALFSGGLGLSLQMTAYGSTGILALTFFIAMVIFAVHLAHIRVYADTDLANVAPSGFTPLFANFMYKRRVAEVLLDLCLIPIAYYSAYHLRFGEANVLFANYQFFIQSLPIVVACQLVSLFIVGGYRGTWRFFGMMDAVVFAKGVVLGTVSAIMVIVFVYHFENYSRAVFVIYAALLMLLLSGSRASFRLLGEFVNRRRAVGQRCIIYGTHGASVATIREAFEEQPLKIIGFADDDPMQSNARVAGYSVIGDFGCLLVMIDMGEVDCVVVNTRVADVDRLQKLESSCRAHDVDLVKIQLNLKPFHVAS